MFFSGILFFGKSGKEVQRMVVEFSEVYKVAVVGIGAGFLLATSPMLIGFVINRLMAILQK